MVDSRNESEQLPPPSLAHMDKCGSTEKMVDECFKDLPPHLMEFLQSTKIVISKQDIIAKCNVFNRGMRCFDAYSARCLQNRKLGMFKNNVDGARKFFKKFCADEDFQRDYLRHKDCFTYIQEDWISCTTYFENILTDDLHDSTRNVSDKFMEFCCARYAYENCIYNSARYKCYKHSAEFARETAKMLSDEKHFSNCRHLEHICANSVRIVWMRSSLLPLAAVLGLRFLRYIVRP
ncbi:GH21009 [Drosophila grimshawi]|uniref:GH21009 n=2 Tax=Drosophila grimshawi TaxID=7222 RepID=B4JRM1_DROGR|nr:GH21009 [Drosophila grimshawi]